MRDRTFAKGVSSNSGVRRRSVTFASSRESILQWPLARWLTVMKNLKSPPVARVAAANALLDRGYAQPGSMPVRFKLPELGSAAGCEQGHGGDHGGGGMW